MRQLGNIYSFHRGRSIPSPCQRNHLHTADLANMDSTWRYNTRTAPACFRAGPSPLRNVITAVVVPAPQEAPAKNLPKRPTSSMITPPNTPPRFSGILPRSRGSTNVKDMVNLNSSYKSGPSRHNGHLVSSLKFPSVWADSDEDDDLSDEDEEWFGIFTAHVVRHNAYAAQITLQDQWVAPAKQHIHVCDQSECARWAASARRKQLEDEQAGFVLRRRACVIGWGRSRIDKCPEALADVYVRFSCLVWIIKLTVHASHLGKRWKALDQYI